MKTTFIGGIIVEYKFDLWYQPAEGNIVFLETIKVTADCMKDAMAKVAQIANRQTQIEYVCEPVTVAQTQKDLL
jgi:hypothetical protein